jgi:histidinol dehydrogenase
VLPTGGLSRSYSGLSTLDFVRWTTYQRVSPQAAAKMAYDVGRVADAEGLPGHAAAARAWERVRDGGRTRLAERAFRKRARDIRDGAEAEASGAGDAGDDEAGADA